MTVYPSDTINTCDGSLISIHHIESLRLVTDEDKTIDTLKGDITLVVSMTSGKEHTISMQYIKAIDSRYTDTDCNALMSAIVDRWKHILKRV